MGGHPAEGNTSPRSERAGVSGPRPEAPSTECYRISEKPDARSFLSRAGSSPSLRYQLPIEASDPPGFGGSNDKFSLPPYACGRRSNDGGHIQRNLLQEISSGP